MAKSTQRKRGRSAAGQGPVSAIRLPARLTAAIDKWAARTGAPSRSEAIRRLLEQGLTGPQSAHKRIKQASKAREMAGQELDRLGDRSLPHEEQERRKRRLTKGPSEFRKMRSDLPKPKR